MRERGPVLRRFVAVSGAFSLAVDPAFLERFRLGGSLPEPGSPIGDVVSAKINLKTPCAHDLDGPPQVNVRLSQIGRGACQKKVEITKSRSRGH